MDILYRDGERKNPVEMKEGDMFYNKAEDKTFIRDKNGYLVEVGSGQAPVVESGTNTKGTWVKYADGTMICYHRTEGKAAHVFAQVFPVRFKTGTIPTVTLQSEHSSRAISTAQPVVEIEYDQTTFEKFNVIRKVVDQTTGVYSTSTTQSRFSYIAIGVWK